MSIYDLGFETIGNATLIVHDRKPLLATDPWLSGSAYFGSWGLSHEVPAEQLEHVLKAESIWISHGHPDHLHMESLALLRTKKILLPDHSGKRIKDFLESEGYDVAVLTDRKWYQLSERVKICSVSDWNQDGILLVDLDGTLVVNLNDASDRSWGYFVKREIAKANTSFLLALSGYGDADMINFIDNEGKRIPPVAALRIPPGKAIAKRCENLGAKYFIPFASHHRYERTDSNWANEYTTSAAEQRLGFESEHAELIDPFVRYDVLKSHLEHINPVLRIADLHEPEEFGDRWDETLAMSEIQTFNNYFERFLTLDRVLDEVIVAVGGKEHRVKVGNGTNRSVRFEVPRASLSSAIRWEIFDDLLIGNFMRTHLSGDWTPRTFGPEFSRKVAKFGDNGRVFADQELQEYMKAYRDRAFLESLRWNISHATRGGWEKFGGIFSRGLKQGSAPYRIGSTIYRSVRK